MSNTSATSITRTEVRDVLLHLSRDRTPGRTCLLHLEVVRRSLIDAGFQPSKHARQYEIGRLLTETVETELVRARRRVGRNGVVLQETHPYTEIRLDFDIDHPELEAWSAVYHLYLRPDLNLGLRDFEVFLGDRHRRTIQRRLRHGVLLLTTRLHDLERQALLASRRERLGARLPKPTRVPLIGVEAMVRRLSEILGDGDHHPIVALGGPGGIGKTVIAEDVMRDQIARERVQEAAWVSCAGGVTPAGVLDAIGRQVLPQGETDADDLLRVLAARSCLIVVDGLNDPTLAEATASVLAALPERSHIVLTGRVGWSGRSHVRAVEVPPLSEPNALALLRSEARGRGIANVDGADDSTLLPLVRAAMGNPHAIQVAAAQLRAFGTAEVVTEMTQGRGVAAALCRDLWDDAWRQSGDAVRAVVGVAARAVTDGRRACVSEIAVCTGLDGVGLREALCGAVDAGLLTAVGPPDDRSYRTPPFLSRYLRNRPERARANAA